MDWNYTYVTIVLLGTLLIYNNLNPFLYPTVTTRELFNSPTTTKSVPFSKQKRTPLQQQGVADSAVEQGLYQTQSKGVKLIMPPFSTFGAFK